MKRLLTIFLVLCIGRQAPAQSFSTNPDFGNGGGALINFHERTYDNFIALGINVTRDGHVLVSGYVNTDAALNTIGPNGIDDPRFGIKGYSFYDFGSWSSNWIQDVLTAPDGKTILIGEQAPCVSLEDGYWTDRGATVMRLLTDGTPDPSFGIRGKAFSFFPNFEFNVFSGLVQPDGKIVVAGRCSDLLSIDVWNRVLLTRFNPNGTIDSGFGINGICRSRSTADLTGGNIPASLPSPFNPTERSFWATSHPNRSSSTGAPPSMLHPLFTALPLAGRWTAASVSMACSLTVLALTPMESTVCLCNPMAILSCPPT